MPDKEPTVEVERVELVHPNAGRRVCIGSEIAFWKARGYVEPEAPSTSKRKRKPTLFDREDDAD